MPEPRDDVTRATGDEHPAQVSRRDFVSVVGGGLGIAVSAATGASMLTTCRPRPDTMLGLDELTIASAGALAAAIQRKQISSVEVVEAHLSRIQIVNPKLNAVVLLLADEARARAREADEALSRGEVWGPLHGVPMTVKDSLDTAGVISTAGTEGRVQHLPAKDATAVARLKAAGAILMGKTNTPELTLSFETDNTVYGRTNNPYDLARSPGGSSGGSAAILAAGGSPLELGSDTGGSIRQPSHFCGIAGMKPTQGRVPRTGHTPLPLGAMQWLTHVGPMARFVDDLVLTLPIVAGPDGRDPWIVAAPVDDPAAVDLRELRVAYHTDNGLAPASPDIARVVSDAARSFLSTGASVSEAVPERLVEAYNLAVRVYYGDGAAWLERVLASVGTTQPSPSLKRNLESARAIDVVDYTATLEEIDRVRMAMLKFWDDFDVMICPVNASTALPHGTASERGKDFTYTVTYNVTGWPVVVVRCGTDAAGLPVGVQVIAPPWRDDIALRVAQQLEREFGGWRAPNLV